MTTKFDIKEMVKDGRKVTFKHFHAGNLVYVTESGFEFPVPIDEAGDAYFLAEDKALMLMRYIRKEIARQEEFESLKEAGDNSYFEGGIETPGVDEHGVKQQRPIRKINI